MKSRGLKMILSSVIMLVLCCTIFPSNVFTISVKNIVNADENVDSINAYYYNQISTEAKRFYKALYTMDQEGLLKTGTAEYDLIANNVLNQSQINANDSKAILEAYGEARDAFRLDHPEIFYIDYNKMGVSMTSSGSSTIAVLGPNNTYNYFAEGFTAANVDDAIRTFNAKLNAIVTKASSETSNIDKIKYVNKYLVDNTEYTYVLSNGEEAPNVHNAYGAIVSGTAVCEGYAHSFKVILDKLGLDCILVQGYAAPSDAEGYQAHMWNYVKVDTYWYGVDVTWNDGENLSVEGYLLRGAAIMENDHITDGIVSSVGFEFTYPMLANYDYGKDDTGFKLSEYMVDNSLFLNVSYEEQSATSLLSTSGEYLAYRFFPKAQGDYEWSDWFYIGSDMLSAGETSTYTSINVTAYNQFVQFAVINKTPEVMDYWYTSKITDSNIIEKSSVYYNLNFGTYTSAPFVKTITPDNKQTIDVMETYDITIEYDENLISTGGTIGIKVESEDPNISKYVTISNITWSASEPTKVHFTFTPSQRFEHRETTYTFTPINLVGETSKATPTVATYMTKKTSIVCNKVFSDDRLYIEAYGKPTLVSTTDLSVDGWTTSDGNKVLSNQRSQMVLVASKPSASQSEDMENGVASSIGSSSAIKSCETFELEIDICSKYTKIPEGSYVQLAFGFPEGYGPEDEGTTFKVYHFKTLADGSIDYDNPEELDCVITEYGLIVTVNSFSPFAVVALDSSKVQITSKNIYASTANAYGTISNNGISKVTTNNNITYTFTPTKGYKVATVVMNGEDITSKIENNSLTLTYDELNNNNTMEVTFTKAYATEEEIPADDVVTPTPSTPETTDPAVSCKALPAVTVIVIVIAVVSIAIYVAFKKKASRK